MLAQRTRLAYLGAIGLALATSLAPVAAHADVIETLVAAPGIDLGDVVAGETFQLEALFTSTDPGEHFTGPIDSHIFALETIQFGDPNPQLQVPPGMITQTSSDLSVTPEIVTWNITALGPGSDEMWVGWSDCNPAAGSTGCAITNLGFSRPEDTEHLFFNVAAAPTVPEPNTLALAAIGLLSSGLLVRRRRPQ